MTNMAMTEITSNSELAPRYHAEASLTLSTLGDAEALAGDVLDAPETDPAEAVTTDVAPVSRTVATEITTLFRQSSHYLGGLLGKMALGFISMPIFTRAFSVADYGLIDLAQKILLLLVALSKMGLQQSALRFFDGKVFAHDKKSERRYYSTMFFGAILMSGVVALCLLTLSRSSLMALIDEPLRALTWFIAALIVLRALESMLWAFMRSEERTKAYNVTTLLMKAGTIAMVCLFLWFGGRSPKTFFSGTVITEVITVAVLTFVLLQRRILDAGLVDFKMFRAGLLFGAPLVLYEIATIILDSGDRVLVRHYLGANALGLYSVAYGLSAQLNEMLILPLNLAIFPIYMRVWNAEGREATISFLSACLDLFILVAAGVCAIAIVSAHDGIVLLASSKYAVVDRLMPVIIIGLLIYTTHVFFAAGLLIHKNTGTMALLLLVSALANIGLNCLLLPRIGLMGGAVATLASYALCILLMGWFSRRVLPLNISISSVARYVGAAALVCFVVSHISVAPAVLNLFVRSLLALLMYGGLVYLLEPRVRGLAAQFLGGSSRPMTQFWPS